LPRFVIIYLHSLIRKIADKNGKYVALLGDLQGPKIRFLYPFFISVYIRFLYLKILKNSRKSVQKTNKLKTKLINVKLLF